MKRYISIIMAVLAMFSTLPMSAQQTQDALYIYRNDGGFNGFFFADIDRIEYSKIDTLGVEQADYVVQEVYALDSVFRIPISAIDSVTFVTPETVYKKDVAHTTESDLWNYVIGSDSVTMIVLASNTPASMIPKVGDKIVTTKSRNYLPGGFYGLVQSVTNGSNGITVNCEVPDLTELFDQWVCKAAGSCDNTETNEARAYTRGDESAADVEIPIKGLNIDIDLTSLENVPFAISKQWSVKGKGKLSAGINHKLRIRMFAAVRLLLGFNYDCTTRLETTTHFDLTGSGEIGGQFDIPLAEGASWTKHWIPNTPFLIEWEGGFSSSVSGKIEFEVHRKLVTSVYSMAQYNNSFYDEERTQIQDSFHTVANETKTSLTGEASVSVGPYFAIYATFIHKKVAKTGFRFDLGQKATVKADLTLTDFLLAAFPKVLPVYMLLNPTPLYDLLNRDGSITYGPFFKCDFEVEFANNEKFKYAKTLFDEGTLAKLTGFDMGLKFEGGLVPQFKNTRISFDEDMVPTASVDIRRPAMLYPPVGFAAYYTKSGKMLGDKTFWKTDHYKESDMKSYSMELPKFGGGKEVTVYPTVKLLRMYEILGSPYTSYTVPAEMEVTPETLEFEAKGGTGKFTVKDNLDRNEDKYERKVDIDFGDEKVKPWLKGSWSSNDYTVTVDESDSTDVRSANISFTIFNEDESIKLEKTVTVIQEAKEDDDPKNATVEPTLLEFPAEGGVKFAKYTFGDYKSLGRQASASWMTQAWSDTNKYPDEVIVCASPNTTKEARVDTIKMGFTMVKGSPFEERFIIPIVVKQAAGPYNLKNAKSYLVGSWRYKERVGGTYDVDRDYLLTFNSDGTYTEDRKEDSPNYDYHSHGTEEGTYEVTEITHSDNNRIKLKVKMTYKSGSREAQIDVYAHRIFYWQPRLHYYDRED